MQGLRAVDLMVVAAVKATLLLLLVSLLLLLLLPLVRGDLEARSSSANGYRLPLYY